MILRYTLHIGSDATRGAQMMNIEGLVLQFQGLEPKPSDQREIDQRLEQLLDQSPSESALLASFFKKGPLIRGIISIHSADGNELRAVVAGTNLMAVTNRLFGKMALKIHEWKRGRFLQSEGPHQQIEIEEEDIVVIGKDMETAHH